MKSAQHSVYFLFDTLTQLPVISRPYLVITSITLSLSLVNTSAVAQSATQVARFHQLISLYENAGAIEEPEIVSCTLSGGTKSYCFKITTGPAPTNHTTGPYCPSSIDTPANEAGTWFINEEVVIADGEFIQNLAVIFEDDEWQMFDPATGQVIRVEGQLGCDVAGDPNSAKDYVNNCVECEVKYLSADTSETYIIPLEPSNTDVEPVRIGPSPGVGLAFNGVKLDAPAPLQLIEGNHTLGLMDACVGHVNPYTGYHYHGLVGCELQITAVIDNHEPLVAVAMDGYDIYSAVTNEQAFVLDACNGHTVEGLGYHYHSDVAGTNQFIGCFTAEYGCTSTDSSAQCDASSNAQKAGGGRPDFAAAAAKLGIDESELRDALGNPPPDFQAAAKKLGVTEEALQQAMGRP